MKSILRDLKTYLILLWESILDLNQYFKSTLASRASKDITVGRLEGEIIRHYHVVEKGLCMPNFRFNSGHGIVRGLVSALAKAEEISDQNASLYVSPSQLLAAKKSLKHYRQVHLDAGYDLGDLMPSSEGFNEDSWSATKNVKRKNFSQVERESFFLALRSRCSVRHLRPDIIPDQEALLKIVEIANTAPSVCNRQASRVHFYTGYKAQEVLSLQNGNRGFGHTIPAVAVVTSDLRFFHSIDERYQGWIDGGMFSMQLLLAIHGLNMGGVALNWSVTNEIDRNMRKITNIPLYERIIMLIGFGEIKGETVPYSRRRPVEEVVTINGVAALSTCG